MISLVNNVSIRFNYFFVGLCIPTHKLKFQSILILVPHPDDEIIGLGGLIIKTLREGGEVYLVYLTDGEGSGVWPDTDAIKKERMALSNQVCQQLGIDSHQIFRLHLPDGSVPFMGDNRYPEVVEQVKEIIENLKPEAVFATSAHDFWPYDHVACAHIAKEAVFTANHKTKLWYYRVWAWYHLRPWQLWKLNFTRLGKINIAPNFEQKRALMNLYLQPTTPSGKPWSGVLPKAMLYPFTKPYEIIEKSGH